MSEPFLTPDDRAMVNVAWPYLMRVLRMFGYGLCALMLLMANTYPVQGFWAIAIAISVLGAGSSSARIGQFALVVLLAMALIPYPMVLSLLS